jgi:hypothetical protein
MAGIIEGVLLKEALNAALDSFEPSDVVRVLADVVRERGEHNAEVSRALIRVSEQLEDVEA